MGWAKVVVAGLLGCMLSAGCQNKLYTDNKALYDENKALRAQNEEQQKELAMRQQSQILQPQAPQQPVVQTNPPETQPVQPSRTTEVEQIGGLETNVSRTTGNTIIHLPSDVFFDPGAATLKSSAKASLDKVVIALKKRFASKSIRVDGHTDSTPIKVSKWASNQELSEARAKAVKDYLVKRGIDASRISTKGFGDTKPRGTDLQKNRRVEIVVLTGQGGE